MRKAKFYLLACIFVIVISSGAIWLFESVTGDKPYSDGWEPPKPSRAEIEEACHKHITEAEAKATEAIKRRAGEFSEFIDSRKSGAKPLSKDIVSFYGKWRAVKPYLPFTKSDGHKEYVIKKFDEHIFTKEQFAAVARRAIEGSVKDLESIENELAVALKQEILGRSLAPDEVPIATEKFKEAVKRLVEASQRDAAKSAGSLVVSEVAAQVAMQVFVRLGVSAGILTASAANSWWSFGAALVIGVVVDIIWERIDDPAGDIEHEIISALDKLSSDASSAIEEEMTKVISDRTKLWNKTVTVILP